VAKVCDEELAEGALVNLVAFNSDVCCDLSMQFLSLAES
jgi:hypothetical protein